MKDLVFNNLYKSFVRIVSKKAFTHFFLLVTFLMALLLRSNSGLRSEAFIDEASVYTIASGYDFKHLALMQHWDVAHPPLLYIFARAAVLLNKGNFVDIHLIRIPFVFFSSLAVFSLYILAKKILRSNMALFIPLWYAIHPFQILNGYGMRPYPILQLLFPIAFFALFDESWNKKWKVIAINLLFIFLFYWDYSSIWFFMIFFGYLFIANFSQPKKIFNNLIQLSPFLISVFIWLPIFFSRLDDALNLANYIKPDLVRFFLTFTGLHLPQIIRGNYNSLFFILLLLILFCNTWVSVVIKPYKNYLIALSALGIPMIAFMIGIVIGPLLLARNHIFTSLMYFIVFSPLLILKKGYVYGLIISVFLVFNVVLSIQSYSLTNGEIIFSPSSFKNKFSGNAVFYFYKGYYSYALHYELLRNGYKLSTNKQFSYYNDNSTLNIYTHRIDNETIRDLNYFQGSTTRAYFVSNPHVNYSDSDKVLINRYCLLDEQTYEHFENIYEHGIVECLN